MDIYEKIEKFYREEQGRKQPALDLKDTYDAAIFLRENIMRWNLQWLENVRSHVNNFDEYRFEIETDL